MRQLNSLLNLVEKGLLFIAFVSFSGVVQQGEDSADSTSYVLNNALKSGALGGLCITSMCRVVIDHQAKKQAILDQDHAGAKEKALFVINSATKTAVVLYASSLETLKTLVSKSNVQYLLYPAFTMFSLILGQRAYFAFKKGKIRDGFALSGMALSNQAATFFTVRGDGLGTQISLAAGAGCSLILLGNEIKSQLSESCSEDDDYRRLNPL